MKTYPIPMVPGPVRVPAEVLAAYQQDYGSADLEPEFLDLYNQTEANLKKIFATQSQVVIQSGEGMAALWSALKSCILPGERVLSIATGLFGDGIADMARSIGAEVRVVEISYDQTISDWIAVERAVEEFRPKMITVVHCETPSGTLNPLAELGQIKREHGVPLLYADVVSSLGGTPVLTDEWSIDLALGGTQKCLSAPPCLAFLTVSPTAWQIIERVNYSGYDALLPFQNAQKDFYFPYTPYWHGLAALYAATNLLLAEGLEQSIARHRRVADECRTALAAAGLKLYPAPGAILSPTISAVKVPVGLSWADLDRKLRAKGLVVGGNYGPLAGKVFRLGHMGTQADSALVKQAVAVIRRVLL
ncbi:MAG TPA: alanine--glyoxylate aminotransferase family protein [Anaerolineaceae bacterium]|nr:alanine--glyoxylate aminotransferase family protein [Anaerolineaceae bacterium]